MNDDIFGNFFGEKPHRDGALAESRWGLNSYIDGTERSRWGMSYGIDNQYFTEKTCKWKKPARGLRQRGENLCRDTAVGISAGAL